MARFSAAEKALTEGNKVRRKNWPKGNYCFLDKRGSKFFLMYFRFKHGEAIPQVFYWDDIKAVNWEIVE